MQHVEFQFPGTEPMPRSVLEVQSYPPTTREVPSAILNCLHFLTSVAPDPLIPLTN